MTDKIIEQYEKIRDIVRPFVNSGKKKEKEFIALIEECVNEFSLIVKEAKSGNGGSDEEVDSGGE